MINHLIFDMDGTLVDSCGICVTILNGMLSDRGSAHVVDNDYARPFMSRGGQYMVSALLGPDCGDPEAELAEFRHRYQRTRTRRSALFPGVLEGLTRLQDAGFTLSICSNKPQNLCEQVLVDTGMAHLFDVVVGGQDGFAPKPAPDLLVETLRALGTGPDNCVYIGDSELDHEVADALSIPFLFLSYGYADNAWQRPEQGVFDCFATMTQAVIDRMAKRDAA